MSDIPKAREAVRFVIKELRETKEIDRDHLLALAELLGDAHKQMFKRPFKQNRKPKVTPPEVPTPKPTFVDKVRRFHMKWAGKSPEQGSLNLPPPSKTPTGGAGPATSLNGSGL